MKLQSIFFIITVLSYLPSFASDRAGNGGTILKCGDVYDLADFAEIKLRPGLRSLNIPESSERVDDQIKKALDRIGRINLNYRRLIKQSLDFYRAHRVDTGSLYTWSTTSDVGSFPLPDGCELQNAINYISDRAIEYSPRVVNLLSNTEQAGLDMHESIYRLARERNPEKLQQGNLPIRRITALLFSDVDDELLGTMLAYYIGGLRESFEFDYNSIPSGKYLKFQHVRPFSISTEVFRSLDCTGEYTTAAFQLTSKAAFCIRVSVRWISTWGSLQDGELPKLYLSYGEMLPNDAVLRRRRARDPYVFSPMGLVSSMDLNWNVRYSNMDVIAVGRMLVFDPQRMNDFLVGRFE